MESEFSEQNFSWHCHIELACGYLDSLQDSYTVLDMT